MFPTKYAAKGRDRTSTLGRENSPKTENSGITPRKLRLGIEKVRIPRGTQSGRPLVGENRGVIAVVNPLVGQEKNFRLKRRKEDTALDGLTLGEVKGPRSS